MMLVIVLSIIQTACNPDVQETDSLVGMWESYQERSDRHGTEKTRIVLEMNSDGECLQSTSSGVSGKVYEELNCTYEIEDDGRI